MCIMVGIASNGGGPGLLDALLAPVATVVILLVSSQQPLDSAIGQVFAPHWPQWPRWLSVGVKLLLPKPVVKSCKQIPRLSS